MSLYCHRQRIVPGPTKAQLIHENQPYESHKDLLLLDRIGPSLMNTLRDSPKAVLNQQAQEDKDAAEPLSVVSPIKPRVLSTKNQANANQAQTKQRIRREARRDTLPQKVRCNGTHAPWSFSVTLLLTITVVSSCISAYLYLTTQQTELSLAAVTAERDALLLKLTHTSLTEPACSPAQPHRTPQIVKNGSNRPIIPVAAWGAISWVIMAVLSAMNSNRTSAPNGLSNGSTRSLATT